MSCAVIFVPIFFAGIIFGASFRDSIQPDVDFGSNIAGAILGGLSENLSLLVGFKNLLIIVLCFSMCSPQCCDVASWVRRWEYRKKLRAPYVRGLVRRLASISNEFRSCRSSLIRETVTEVRPSNSAGMGTRGNVNGMVDHHDAQTRARSISASIR